ncbi:MAG: thymidine phosphorylase [Planctomycetota bacterium]|nr:thymidine phosphorylase [Planctomycetota bacterium]
MRHHPARLIRKNREGGALTGEEIQDLVAGVVDGGLGSAQLGAFLMAVCVRGMTVEETVALTLAMRDSGDVLTRHGNKKRVDKHSTGGVGDKVSLLLAPMMAAAGLSVPMISGRGLGHTGGTIDKLESIPGYRTDLDRVGFDDALDQCGYAMAGPNPDLAPADGRMYATRDITGTVDSVPLITSSILSKKLAENLDGLVMDIKVGRASFLPRREGAEQLRESLLATGTAAGLAMRCLMTDMDHPLGRAIGNSLEVVEVLQALDGNGPEDLLEVTLALGVEMLQLAEIETDRERAAAHLRDLLDQGAVREVFVHNLRLQGGDESIVDDHSRLGRARHIAPVVAGRDGYVVDVDPLALGEVVVDLGGGRRQPGDAIDPLVGIELQRLLGDPVAAGEPLAVVHAGSPAALEAASERVLAAMPVGDEQRHRGNLIVGAVD